MSVPPLQDRDPGAAECVEASLQKSLVGSGGRQLDCTKELFPRRLYAVEAVEGVGARGVPEMRLL